MDDVTFPRFPFLANIHNYEKCNVVYEINLDLKKHLTIALHPLKWKLFEPVWFPFTLEKGLFFPDRLLRKMPGNVYGNVKNY